MTATANTIDNSEDFVATLKYGAGYDAPWLVIRDASAEGLKTKLEEAATTGLMETIGKAANLVQTYAPKKTEPQGKPSFQNGQVQYNGGGGNSGGPSRPANVPDYFTFKEGTSKAGKAYKGWFPPRGSDEKPVFVN